MMELINELIGKHDGVSELLDTSAAVDGTPRLSNWSYIMQFCRDANDSRRGLVRQINFFV